MVYRFQFVRTKPVKSALSRFEVELNTIAVRPGLAADSFDVAFKLQATLALQIFQQNGPLLFQLKAVAGMLVLAASANAKVLTFRRNALRRRLLKFGDRSAQQTGFHAFGSYRNVFPRQHQRNQHHLALQPRKTFTAVHQLLYFNIRHPLRCKFHSYSMRARVFSGVQPSGQLHIGNYLGALKSWAEIQADYESIFCIVDSHAITVYQDPAELQAKIRETAALFIAAGIDPAQSSIMVQSSVSGHAELAWMLTCVTPLGWLQRMTQFKAKAEKQETIGDGLLQYPVLMAADILLYQAAIVPVGEDQAQHLELARDIAQRFNSLYGETFVMPATHLPTVGARVMGLDDPTQKMSKSATGTGHAIALLDDPKVIQKKIMRATTDSLPAVDSESMGAGVANLLAIGQACDGSITRESVAGMRYGDFKKRIAEAVVARLQPIQQRYREVTADPSYIDSVLAAGRNHILPIAEETIRKTKAAMGLYVS